MPNWINIANLLTLGRLLAVPFAALDILSGRNERALAIVLAAGLTDAIDGAVARGFGVATSAGAYFDPIVDKIFLSTVYIILAITGSLPWWLTIEIFVRDALILISAGTLLLLNRMRRFPPSIWGKLSTFLQIALALSVLVSRAYPDSDWSTWGRTLVGPAAAATAWSGFHYLWRSLKDLNIRQKKQVTADFTS